MFYRVDYLLGLILAAAVIGTLLSRRATSIAAHRLARLYFFAVVVILGVNIAVLVHGILLENGPLWKTVGGVNSDAGQFLFGALFGLALRRPKPSDLLGDPSVYSALCLAGGVGFVSTGFVKAFYMQSMIEFFTQSGYSLTFLKFIMTAEVLGGIGLLVPWTVLPAVAGLSIDMFGAIYTHVHNGDPINDSTGAIGQLIRLSAIVFLWVLRRRSTAPAGFTRRALALAGIAAVACLAAAVAGAAVVRRSASPQPAATQASAISDQFDYFLGSWNCAGTFARSGVVIEADLHFERSLDGRWLLFRHDDRPPHSYHALAEWSRGEREWTATVQDSSGGLRLFHTPGWQGPRLVWEGNTIGDSGPARQRFTVERTNPSLLFLSYETQKPDGWRLVDSSACTRRNAD